jgi:hypothetical protein
MAERGQPALPSLTTETLPGGHFFVDQFPEETARIVSEFLSGEAREDLPRAERPARFRHMQANESTGKIGAGEGIRTLDPNLGKVVLYP